MFNVNISLENNNIIGEFMVDSYFFEPSKYEYAFYLCQNNEKIRKQPYSRKMNVVFELEGVTGKFHIRAFIRDIELRNKRAYNSEKISIDN